MRQPLEFLSEALPGVKAGLPCGKLFAFEGPAAVGRTTQIGLLADHLELEGYAPRIVNPFPAQPQTVSDAARALRELAAFAVCIENEILPALREGLVVLADGCVYSWMARMQARGLPAEWLRLLTGFALIPHATFYLRADPAELAARAANRGFGEEESAADLRLGPDLYESFLRYQGRVITALDGFAVDHKMIPIEASGTPDAVLRRILRDVRKL